MEVIRKRVVAKRIVVLFMSPDLGVELDGTVADCGGEIIADRRQKEESRRRKAEGRKAGKADWSLVIGH